MSLLDDFPIKFTCRKCGSKFSQLVRDVKAQGKATCSGCGDTADLDEATRKQIVAGEEKVAGFMRSLK